MVRRLRVACLQLNPQRYAVERNLRRADALLEGYDSKGIDLLVLPEMAMTGYMFESRTDIEPYLECASEAQGPTLQWASKTASRLGSHILVGYPERSGTRAFNSAALFDHTGKLAYNYRKHFLYDQDYKWSDEGEAFGLLQLHDSKIPTVSCRKAILFPLYQGLTWLGVHWHLYGPQSKKVRSTFQCF